MLWHRPLPGRPRRLLRETEKALEGSLVFVTMVSDGVLNGFLVNEFVRNPNNLRAASEGIELPRIAGKAGSVCKASSTGMDKLYARIYLGSMRLQTLKW